MIRTAFRLALHGALLLVAAASQAQNTTDLAQAQARFDQEVARCNGGKLPAPERDACVRNAGAALDRARGSAPGTVTTRTPDRRATVVKPEGAPVPGATETVRSRRSTTVVPIEQAPR